MHRKYDLAEKGKQIPKRVHSDSRMKEHGLG